MASTDAEKQKAVVDACARRWAKGKNCRGCSFYRHPQFPLSEEDKQERCSQWDIIKDWARKREKTEGRR